MTISAKEWDPVNVLTLGPMGSTGARSPVRAHSAAAHLPPRLVFNTAPRRCQSVAPKALIRRRTTHANRNSRLLRAPKL